MFSASISGLNTAAAQFAAAAANVAGAATGETDLAADAVAISQARAAFEVNLQVLKVQKDTLGTLLDLLA